MFSAPQRLQRARSLAFSARLASVKQHHASFASAARLNAATASERPRSANRVSRKSEHRSDDEDYEPRHSQDKQPRDPKPALQQRAPERASAPPSPANTRFPPPPDATRVKLPAVGEIVTADGARMYSFKDLKLASQVHTKLAKFGYRHPTAVQVAAIPVLMRQDETKEDVIIHDMTGCGKTLAYLLPILSQIDNFSTSVQAVIMVPTRELAYQVYNVAKAINAGTAGKRRKANPLRIAKLVGLPVEPQVAALRKQPPHVVIGTPKILGHLFWGDAKVCAFPSARETLRWLVMDEVDHILLPFSRKFAQWFLDNLHTGPRNSSKRRNQLVFVSATITPDTVAVANQYMHKPQTVTGKRAKQLAIPGSIQHFRVVRRAADDDDKSPNAKRALIPKLFAALEPRVMLVFVNDAAEVEPLGQFLQDKGFRVGALSSNASKEERHLAYESAQHGRISILIATDMASRGLDMKGLTHVVNYDLPTDVTSYLHRAGRVERVGGHGRCMVISIVDEKPAQSDADKAERKVDKTGRFAIEDVKHIRALESSLGFRIPEARLTQGKLEAVDTRAPQPIDVDRKKRSKPHDHRSEAERSASTQRSADATGTGSAAESQARSPRDMDAAERLAARAEESLRRASAQQSS